VRRREELECILGSKILAAAASSNLAVRLLLLLKLDDDDGDNRIDEELTSWLCALEGSNTGSHWVRRERKVCFEVAPSWDFRCDGGFGSFGSTYGPPLH
jgi:hypothetical protein